MHQPIQNPRWSWVTPVAMHEVDVQHTNHLEPEKVVQACDNLDTRLFPVAGDYG
jgi:hypothetical protein